MEKNQNDRGITLSFRFSEAIHWTTKRMEKNACPTNPTDSQNCSLLIAPSCEESSSDVDTARLSDPTWTPSPKSLECELLEPRRRRRGAPRSAELVDENETASSVSFAGRALARSGHVSHCEARSGAQGEAEQQQFR